MITRKKDILLVEDDDQLRTVLIMLLLRSGYSVRVARDGFEALRAIRQGVPEMLLTDLFMPGMSGFELLYVVCTRFPSIRTMAMSGAFSGRIVPAGVDADAFYEKGTHPEHLLQGLAMLQRRPAKTPADVKADRVPWVTRSGLDANGEPFALLCCLECLRAFSVKMGVTNAELRRADCPHCLHTMGYRVVQGAGPAAKPNFVMSLKQVLPARAGYARSTGVQLRYGEQPTRRRSFPALEDDGKKQAAQT